MGASAAPRQHSEQAREPAPAGGEERHRREREHGCRHGEHESSANTRERPKLWKRECRLDAIGSQLDDLGFTVEHTAGLAQLIVRHAVDIEFDTTHEHAVFQVRIGLRRATS